MVFLIFAGDPSTMAFGSPLQLIKDMDTCKDLLKAYDLRYRDNSDAFRGTVDRLHCVSFQNGEMVEIVGIQALRAMTLPPTGP
jgi:hypothetical protein